MHHILKILALFVICAPAWALSLADLSEGEASGGLKEALTQGASQAVEMLGKDGGFMKNAKVRIPLPDGLAQAEPILRGMGKGKDLDALVSTMNKAAEAAVPKAKPLLLDAVKAMSVEDAKKILAGGDDSVTRYFKEKTSGQLAEMFEPAVKESTDKLSLSKSYNALASKGSSFGLLKEEDTKVESYVTRKALDGLYLMIAEQEKAIRKDPIGAAGSLAKKVFGAL